MINYTTITALEIGIFIKPFSIHTWSTIIVKKNTIYTVWITCFTRTIIIIYQIGSIKTTSTIRCRIPTAFAFFITFKTFISIYKIMSNTFLTKNWWGMHDTFSYFWKTFWIIINSFCKTRFTYIANFCFGLCLAISYCFKTLRTISFFYKIIVTCLTNSTGCMCFTIFYFLKTD
jgi:hypothetical protein